MEIAFKGYTMLRSFLWESIFNIANSFENVMFISHEQEVVEKNKFGREITKFQPVFEDKLRDQMSGLMGVIARTVKTTGESGQIKYELHISNTDDEFGGSRLPIKATSIPLTKEAFDDNFLTKKETYDKKLETETTKRKSIIG